MTERQHKGDVGPMGRVAGIVLLKLQCHPARLPAHPSAYPPMYTTMNRLIYDASGSCKGYLACLGISMAFNVRTGMHLIIDYSEMISDLPDV